MEENNLKQTCLHSRHVALGALMQPFGGWDMPIQYSSIIEEHNAVRHDCGVFDVSHMGEATVKGPDSERFVNHIFTNDVSQMPAGKILYGMMLYPDGGTVDDLLVYKMAEDTYFLVINAANTDKDVAWMREQSTGYDIQISDVSTRYGQLAVQGPAAQAVMEEVLGIACSELVFYTSKTLPSASTKITQPEETIIVSRTGYTGEDGFEIYGSGAFICDAWDKLLASHRCAPCGLGCRDTLRFEVGLPLYGNELSAEISPVMAGISVFCKLQKTEFIGKDAIARQKADGVKKKIVGIELSSRAVPRHGYAVLAGGKLIGYVTTGYHSISTDKSVCMALIDTEHSKIGTPVDVQIRKKTFAGTVAKKKFYDKHYKK